MKAARHLGSVLLIQSVLVGSGFAQQVITPDESQKIFAEIRGQHRLTVTDRDRVLRAMKSPRFGDGQSAVLLLLDASEHGLFPRAEVLKEIEARTVLEGAPEARLLAREYATALGMWQKPDDATTASFKQIREHANVGTIGNAERLAIDVALSSPIAGNALLAGTHMVSRGPLDAASFRWETEKLAAQVARSRGPTKQFWRYVSRICQIASRKR